MNQLPEEGLLRAEDLDGGSRELGKVDEGTGMADETGADLVADERLKVGGDGVHPVVKVLLQLSPETNG